jgi:uncharacterized DUF497 family protein
MVIIIRGNNRRMFVICVISFSVVQTVRFQHVIVISMRKREKKKTQKHEAN